MQTCDVLVVGGGPAGSSCAWKLRQAGLDVLVIDRSLFPRDKTCAGWITPQVIAALDLDCADYRRGRTLQAITGFRTGWIGRSREVETIYGSAVSFGIRRCEFDHYLLERSGARLRLGTAISSIHRSAGQWVVNLSNGSNGSNGSDGSNNSLRAPMLVGAGGHFCPVARWLNTTIQGGPLVVAQEGEFSIDADDAASWPIEAEIPELYFCPDLKGYGWCFRKERHINIGLGRLDRRSLPKACAEFVKFLQARRRVPGDAAWRWHGHAYLIARSPRRRVLGAGVMLIGDAAGLAYTQSGEGIRPAIESGLLAASTILAAGGRYARERIEPYEQRLRERFGAPPASSLSHTIASGAAARFLPRFFDIPWVARHLLLDRWFLHALEPALATDP
jgi:flavin-dependent dehydrogenase